MRLVFTCDDWNEEVFEQFRDGERVECSFKGENLVVMQTASEVDNLTESLSFCEGCKSKKFTISKIRSFLRPVRGLRRQSLPPFDVSIFSVTSLVVLVPFKQ